MSFADNRVRGGLTIAFPPKIKKESKKPSGSHSRNLHCCPSVVTGDRKQLPLRGNGDICAACHFRSSPKIPPALQHLSHNRCPFLRAPSTTHRCPLKMSRKGRCPGFLLELSLRSFSWSKCLFARCYWQKHSSRHGGNEVQFPNCSHSLLSIEDLRQGQQVLDEHRGKSPKIQKRKPRAGLGSPLHLLHLLLRTASSA